MPGPIASAALTIDVADLRPSVFGQTQIYFNGQLQLGLFDVEQGFQGSGLITVNLDADDIERANAAGEFVLTIDRAGSADFIAFDSSQLSGLLA